MATDPKTRVAELTELIETALASVLPAAGTPARDDFGVARLMEAMDYSLRLPGKRLRPLLFLTAAETLGADPAPLSRFACGIETIHAYSLVHDDLPAMDDDELRRGQPTNHVVYGEGMAILAGDGLLTQAAVLLLDPVGDPGLQIQSAAEVMHAAGFDGMVGGQAADLLAEGREPELSLLEAIHRRKTGALIRASAVGGGRMAGGDPDTLAALEVFSDHYGLAFQIADDIKDEIAPTEMTGKAEGGDRDAGKMTYPGLLGVERSLELCRQEIEAAVAALGALPDAGVLIEQVARDSIEAAFAAAESSR